MGVNQMYPGTINIYHEGDCASDLSLFIYNELNRTDVEIVGFVRNQQQNSYEVLMIIRSREKKEIAREERSKMMLFLLGHSVVRIIENVTRLKGAVIFYATILDGARRGLIRTISQNAHIHPDVGMPVYNGVESITAFYPSSQDFYDTLSILASRGHNPVKFHSRDGVIDRELLRSSVPYPEGVVDDPNFLPNIFLTLQERSRLKELVRGGFSKLRELIDFISEKMPWLIPILKKIAEMGRRSRGFPYFL